jgi:gluconokinase
VYLKGAYDRVLRRLQGRTGHYMKASLLDDQFALLEEPAQAIVVDIDSSTDEIVETIVRALDVQAG